MIGSSLLLTGAGAGLIFRHEQSSTTLLSACDSSAGGHRLVGCDLNGHLTFAVDVPMRAHDVCQNPVLPMAAFFSRRPGTEIYIVDVSAGYLQQTVESRPGYHFYGHGVFSADGRWLFATENDYQHNRGIVGVYDGLDRFKRVDEFSTGGIGPHQLAWMNDRQTLVIANGGILTNPRVEREMLNLDTMAPSLAYLDSRNGQLIDQFMPADHQMSIRHLAVSCFDQVVIGVQYQGDPWKQVPLVLSHKGEDSLQPMTADTHWPQLKQYIASVAISGDGREAITTTPRGAKVSRWDLTQRTLISASAVEDVAGAGFLRDRQQFIVSNGKGELLALDNHIPMRTEALSHNATLRWDNHLALIS